MLEWICEKLPPRYGVPILVVVTILLYLAHFPFEQETRAFERCVLFAAWGVVMTPAWGTLVYWGVLSVPAVVVVFVAVVYLIQLSKRDSPSSIPTSQSIVRADWPIQIVFDNPNGHYADSSTEIQRRFLGPGSHRRIHTYSIRIVNTSEEWITVGAQLSGIDPLPTVLRDQIPLHLEFGNAERPDVKHVVLMKEGGPAIVRVCYADEGPGVPPNLSIAHTREGLEKNIAEGPLDPLSSYEIEIAVHAIDYGFYRRKFEIGLTDRQFLFMRAIGDQENP